MFDVSISESIIRMLSNSNLTWGIGILYSPGEELTIVSDPVSKAHIINIPLQGPDWRDMDFMHELAHAWLAENVHPLMSTGIFEKGTDPDEIEKIVWQKRVAADWFADALLIEWDEEATKNEIAYHFECMLRFPHEGAPEMMILIGGLLWAEAIYWEVKRDLVVPSLFQPVVNVLLRQDPSRPSLEAMESLINSLAALNTNKRVKAIQYPAGEVWRLNEE